MKQGITTLLFDFGGVLVDLDKQLCINAFAKLGIKNVDSLISKFTQSGLFLSLEKGDISGNEFRDELRKLTVEKLSDEQIDTAWNSFLISIPEYKLEMLEELRKKYRILMLSNTNEIHFEQVAKSEFRKKGLNLNDYFDKCYLSYELGMAKPNKDIYLHILETEKISANQILFIDDGEVNIKIAKELGFETYLAKDHEDFRPIFN